MEFYTGSDFCEIDELKSINNEVSEEEISTEDLWKSHISRFITAYGLPVHMLFNSEIFKTIKHGCIVVPFQKDLMCVDVRSFSIFKLYKRHIYHADYNPNDSKVLINLCAQPIKISATNHKGKFVLLNVSHKLAISLLEAYNGFIEEFIDVMNMIQEEIAALPEHFDKEHPQYRALIKKLRGEAPTSYGYFLP